MNASAPLFQIEAKRQAAKISREQLASVANISLRHYERLASNAAHPRPTTIAKLQKALARLERIGKGPVLDERSRLVLALYNAALALLCQRENADPAEVLRHDPARRATSDPAWLAASRLRQRAIALVNQGLDVPQGELARALNMTPAGICLAMKAVQDARDDDPKLEATMDELERMFRGGAW